ncbi:MAG: hypothetical protein Q9179_004223 [Wetmoreana sp. 5 TL-2023]
MLSLDESRSSRPTTPPTSLQAPISPPAIKRSTTRPSKPDELQPNYIAEVSKQDQKGPSSALAAIEAGEIHIQDHLSYFSSCLVKVVKSVFPGPQLPIVDYVNLYERNCHKHGRHFVVHQHDHPVAGLHYDLRVQISKSSSISFAIMYGLPGNPNSRRLNRNATETRVHNLWSHLIETASSTTGSMLIWDTGEYSILPWHKDQRQTDDELSDDTSEDSYEPGRSNNEQLHQAFRNRKIRIRLHGTRLPPDYTLSMRLLTSNNRHEQPKKPLRKRRRKASENEDHHKQTTPEASDGEAIPQDDVEMASSPVDASRTAYEREIEEQEDEQVRLSNAYLEKAIYHWASNLFMLEEEITKRASSRAEWQMKLCGTKASKVLREERGGGLYLNEGCDAIQCSSANGSSYGHE